MEVNFDAVFQGAIAGDYALLRMIYERTTQEDILGQIIDCAIHQLRALDLSGKAKEQFWEEIKTPLLVCGAFFKRPGFASEEEWRVWKLELDRSTAAERPGSYGTKIWHETLPLKEEFVSQIVLGPRSEIEVSGVLALTQAAGLGAVQVIRIDQTELV